MILDGFLLLSGTQAANGTLTPQSVSGAGNVVSSNTVDIAPLTLGGNQASDFGAGEDLTVVFSVVTAPTVGTSVQFQIIQADDPALSVNVQVINQTDAFTIAQLPAGTLVPVSLDIVAPLLPKRYIGARYVNVGAIATFNVLAAIVKDPQAVRNIFYKSGFAVS